MTAVTDYVEAVEDYHKLLDKYFRIIRILEGGSVLAGDPLTSLARRDIRDAYNKMNEAQKKLDL